MFPGENCRGFIDLEFEPGNHRQQLFIADMMINREHALIEPDNIF